MDMISLVCFLVGIFIGILLASCVAMFLTLQRMKSEEYLDDDFFDEDDYLAYYDDGR